MEKTLRIVGKNSNEILTLRYPSSLLDFCDYDFSYFAKHSIDLCNESLKTGVPDFDRMAELRRDVQTAHGYIENNIRTIYEKIVLDCWIDYVCRRDSISISQLWNRFIRCKSEFDKFVFQRLCDFRYNRSINEWQNIVRVQDYARCKVDFIFVDGISTVEEAVARRNYFDLTFSVTAREMGCRIEDLGMVKTFSIGRVPTAPFLFPTISKDIVRNVLTDFDYSEDYSDIGEYGELSDRIAMDAFSKMRAGLPKDLSNYGVVRGKMDGYFEKLYMPCSLKAAIDLEIDVMIENGGWLAKCKRCGRYYLRDRDYTSEYCSRIVPNGKTCLELWEEEHPKPTIDAAMEKKCSDVTDEMYARVDKTMSVKEYEYWYNYLEAMKQKVRNGEISIEELDNFLNYSLKVDITKSTPIVEVPKREPELSAAPKERVVKPFVPERIRRDEIVTPPSYQPPDPDDERALKEGFFTSPSKQRSKNERPQISHVIRNGESLGKQSYDPRPDPAGFQPFGVAAPERQPEQRRSSYEDLQRLERQLEEEKRIKREKAAEIARRRELDEEEEARRNVFRSFEQSLPSFDEQPEKAPKVSEKTPKVFEKAPRASEEALERLAREHVERAPRIAEESLESRLREPEPPPIPVYDEVPEELKDTVRGQPRSRGRNAEKSANKPPEIPPPAPRVIKKNAAAISAYGKAAGAPVVTAPQTNIVLPREEQQTSYMEDMPEAEPFKDIGSIFDVLEQSQDGGQSRSKSTPAPAPQEYPQRVTRDNDPAGIWTEDRELFKVEPPAPEEPEPEQSELDMLKSKKHNKSNKTRRLYDVIMREPDDNPNFRRKK